MNEDYNEDIVWPVWSCESEGAIALFEGERMIVLYTYESDLGDGWENPSVHNVPINSHIKALKMGTNIIIYYLTN